MRPSLLVVVVSTALASLSVTGASASTPLRNGPQTATQLAPPSRSSQRPPAVPAAGGPSTPWVNVGPNRLPGRFHCTTWDQLNSPNVACGSDGSSYWWGDATGASSWSERGRELGGGIQQMTDCPFYPASQSPYQRLSVVRLPDLQMFNTVDDGATWRPDTLQPQAGYTLGPAVKLGADGYFSNLAYALVYAQDSAHHPGIAFLKSFNGGGVYAMTRFLPAGAADLWCSRAGSSVLLLAWADAEGNVEIERSTDQGGSWQPVSTFGASSPASDSLVIVAQEAADPDSMHVWLLEESELYASQDGGQTFTDTNLQLSATVKRPLGTSLVHSDLIVWSDGDRGQHWSPDGGTTVHDIPSGWPASDNSHPVGGDIDCWLVNSLSSPHRRAMLATGTEEFYLATGVGVYTWSLENSLPQLLTNDLAVSLQVSDLYTRRTGTEKYDIVCASRDAGVVGMTTSDNVNLPADSYWNQLMWITNEFEVAHVVTSYKPTPADPVAFADFQNGTVMTNGNGSGSGTAISIGALRHESMVADPVGPYRFYAVSYGIYRETWNRTANTWLEETLPSPIGSANGYGIGFAIAPSSTSRWYLETDAGKVYYSTDGGGTWTLGTVSGTAPGVIDDAYHYTRITVNPTNALEAWIVGTSVVHTTNGGASWSTLTAGLPAGTIHAWALDYDVPTARPYLATDSGPYAWSGTAWTDLAPAGGIVPAVAFRAVESVPWAGVVRWGTWGRGVWDYATGNTAGVTGKPGAPLELAMRENPVRDVASLDYVLPQAGHVRLELLDVAGRRVAMLVDGVQPAGAGNARLDGRSLGVGVYFARLVTGEGMRTTKVVVLR